MNLTKPVFEAKQDVAQSLRLRVSPPEKRIQSRAHPQEATTSEGIYGR